MPISEGVEVTAFVIYRIIQVVPATISVVFVAVMGFRFYLLHSDNQIKRIRINKSLALRCSLVVLEISAEVTSFFLGTFYDQYTYYRDALGYLILINVLTLSMQIFLMVFWYIQQITEFNKKQPLFIGHKLYWICCFIEVSILLILLLTQVHNFNIKKITEPANYVILSVRILCYGSLLIYTLLIQHQDYEEFEDISFWSSEIPNVEMTKPQEMRPRISTSRGPVGADTSFFTVEVMKRWNIMDGQLEFKMQVTVLPSLKQISIKRNINQLLELHLQIEKECADFLNDNLVIAQELQYIIQTIKESQVQQSISYIQKYLNTLNNRVEFACTSLLDFLQIDTDDRLEVKETSLINKQDIKQQYLPYFNVDINSHSLISESYIAYNMTLSWTREPQSPWVITKRYKEFFELNETLKQFLNLKALPALPKKQYTNLSEQGLNDRQLELEVYIKNLLNDRIYHHYSLFNFIGLTNEQRDRVKKIQDEVKQEAAYMDRLSIMSLGYDEAGDLNNKYYRYIFEIGAIDSKYLIYKRFTQFEELHSNLKLRFGSTNEIYHLPTLPLKHKNNPITREDQLLTYLKQLLKVPFIGECVHFRQFIELKEQSNDQREKSMSIQDLAHMIKKMDEDNERDSTRLDMLSSRRV